MLRHYNFIVGYRPGKQNSVADALSRRADHYPQGEPPEPYKPFPEDKMRTVEELEIAAVEGAGEALDWALLNTIVTDATLQEEIKRETQEGDPKGEEGQIWVLRTQDLRRKIVELYHDTPITGHLGIAGTYELVSRGYHWENMHNYIKQYVLGCRTCTRAKKRNYKAYGLLKPLPVPEGPWQWTQSDHIVKLPKSQGFDSIYMVVDRFTKMAHFIPTTEKAGEEDLVNLHLKHVWKLHGTPLVHSTDRHGNFTSKYTQRMFKALGIEQCFSTAYHPQSQGQVENLNGWLETFLRMFCNHSKDNWSNLLHMAEFAWNNHFHTSLGTTPFYANSGMHPTFTDVPSVGQQDTPTRIARLLETRETIREQLLKAQIRQKGQYDKGRTHQPQYNIGNKVYLSTDNLVTDEGSKKLSDLRTGPFEIIGQAGENTFRLRLPPHMKVHPVFNVTLLSPERRDTIPGRVLAEPAPVIIEGHKEYEIDRFLDSNWYGKHFQYKVRWKGYDKEHDEWIFRDDLEEDLGQEGLARYEGDFFEISPTAKRHTDTIRERTKGKRGFSKKK
jgi:transposase InsO family protein